MCTIQIRIYLDCPTDHTFWVWIATLHCHICVYGVDTRLWQKVFVVS